MDIDQHVGMIDSEHAVQCHECMPHLRPSAPAPAAARFTIQLNVDLSHTPAALNAIVDLLATVADVPGAVVSTGDWPATAPPSPRSSTSDDRLHIDPLSRKVLRQGVPLDLTRLEFDLLLYLATRPNLAHRRSTLLAARR
jgi:DNA-binding response OmpR family regulator